MKATLVVSPPFDKGGLFDPNSPLNRDNLLVFYHELKKIFHDNKIDLNTSHFNPVKNSKYVIYNEMPTGTFSEIDKAKSSLLLFESDLIRPDNWDLKKHAHFSKIFTWNDTFVDNEKYFKFNFCLPSLSSRLPPKENRKLCTLIAGNKSVTHPLELYSKRIEAIEWFERYQPKDFEFYGMFWEKRAVNFNPGFYSRLYNRFLRFMGFGVRKWKTYKGPVDSKLPTLSQYKFSICYENGRDIPGYITEKILDCFFAGTVPIYWGAPNVEKYIPGSCFIDKRNFNSYEQLYTYLKSMKEAEYENYLSQIRNFLKSSAFSQFDPAYNAKIVFNNIVGIG